MKKYIKLFEEFIDESELPTFAISFWGDGDLWSQPDELDDQFYILSDALEESLSMPEPYVLMSTWGDVYNVPGLEIIYNMSDKIINSDYIGNSFSNKYYADRWEYHARKCVSTENPQFYTCPDVGKKYTPNPTWNEYWEEGLTFLVTNLCPLIDCDEITQRDILAFASVNNMQRIVEYCLSNGINYGMSDDVKNIANTALKGNHKLR